MRWTRKCKKDLGHSDIVVEDPVSTSSEIKVEITKVMVHSVADTDNPAVKI